MNETGGGELVELSRTECLRLLAAGVIGRVICTDHALPTAQPVNHVLDDEEIIFRTTNGSKLAAATHNAVIAFQLDQFDTTSRTGWSVLGIGEAYEVLDPHGWSSSGSCSPTPGCATTTRTPRAHPLHPLGILTGRRILAGTGPAAPTP